MKTVICNPPWLVGDRIGFRSNVRWPFTVPLSVFREKGSASYHFPIYQAYLAAAMLREGLEVGVIDATLDLLDTGAFIKKLGENSGDICVIETSTPSFPADIQTMRAVKEELGLPIIAIGPHTSIYHEEVMSEHPFIDYIVRGEYEITVLELVKNLQRDMPVTDVQGITYRKNGDIIVNEDRPFIQDLDRLPYPARDLYSWERYHEPNFIALPWITMITSRGCPFKCTFCLWPQVMYGHRFRTRSAGNIVDEIEYCVDRYHPGEIFFDDDTFTIGKRRVLDICGEIRSRRIAVIWSCMGRIDTVDEETLSAMYAAGCRKIKFGIETGSPAIMAAIKKGIDLERAPAAFAAAKKCGLEVHGTFMIGAPGETPETVRETIDLAKRLPNDSLQFSIATPFPGTEFFEFCRREGFLVTEKWSDYDGSFGAVMSYPHLNKKEIEGLYETARRECYPGRWWFTALLNDIKKMCKNIFSRGHR